MATLVQLDDVQHALDARDPSMVSLLIQMIEQDLRQIVQDTPGNENEFTFPKFFDEIQSRNFRRKSLQEQWDFRKQRIAQLEASEAETVSPVRFRSHEIILKLWETNDAFSRKCLLGIIRDVPLVYGPFKALKQIFKEAEAADDTQIFGALGARFDVAFANKYHNGVSRLTLGYLCRRAWRYLRRIGETLPSVYPDVAADFLIHYLPDDLTYDWQLNEAWVLNHIFFHQTRCYSATKFRFGRYVSGRGYQQKPNSRLKHRAFEEAWKRSPRPLFALLLEAQCDPIREYAAAALKSDFRATLREIEPDWVARLVSVRSSTIDDFVIWILDNVPKFEQSKFRELGLHDAVLMLFDSGSPKAAKFAAEYARTHARDLSVDHLIRLVSNHNDVVSKLATDLLKALDPRKDVGLDAWGRLLENDSGSKVAADMLQKHFTGKDLTPEWFAERLLHGQQNAQKFAVENLPRLHKPEKLGAQFFTDLMLKTDPTNRQHRGAIRLGNDSLQKLGLDLVETETLQRLLLHPATHYTASKWGQQGLVEPKRFGAEFLKRVVFKPTYDTEPLVVEAHAGEYSDCYQYDPLFASTYFAWLADVRQFSPEDLGFEWLMGLVARSEVEYHDFAVATMSKGFLPADFAPQSGGDLAPAADADDGEVDVDLDGASFVFTGKLATMTRAEAKKKVTDAGGTNSGTVGKKLDYLVIGDEGSPLYGEGRKGSKQLKGEQLMEEGAPLRIMSETAFLQMLAGETREFSEDDVHAGCTRLWQMMTEAEVEDEPLARFAHAYIRQHHPEICLKETDRPVDPGAEIPDSFLTFEVVAPLFSDDRVTLRSLALELASYEFARWQPSIDGIVAMCETPFPEVRDFVIKSLTCEDLPEHRKYRLNPDVLTVDAVYSFCESRDAKTRSLGMMLIGRHRRLQLPDALFRLTESPDGRVRGFVIRTLWSLYRDRHITSGWRPKFHQRKSTVGTKKKAMTEEEVLAKTGSGAPNAPGVMPAEYVEIQELLRRVLFELPPGPPPKSAKSATDDMVKLKPLPARKSKLNLVETVRDLAIEDKDFAEVVLPVLIEFMDSRGKSEQAACIVAVTRIKSAHGLLEQQAEIQEVVS